jgi:hypothetical protein
MSRSPFRGGHVGKVLAGAGAVAVAAVLAGCSSTPTLVNHPAGSSSLAHVGDTLSLKNQAGRSFNMKLVSVIQPAHSTNGAAAPNHKRYVAVTFHITDTSGGGVSGNSNADATLLGSDDADYFAANVTLKQCKGKGAKFSVSPGQSRTACVAFEVKSGVNVASVDFSPAAGAASVYGQWLVP